MAKKTKGKGKKPTSIAAADDSQPTAADPWIPCAAYEIDAALDGSIIRFDLTAYDAAGSQYGLNIRGKNDRPELIQQLMPLLGDWPAIKWDFQAKTDPQGQVGTISAVRKRP